MKKTILFLFILWNLVAFGQIEDAWVYFNDKPLASYYLDNPLEMLSQRALDRRTTQNIALNFTDVPIHQAYIDQIIDVELVEVKAKSKWMNALHVRGIETNISLLLNLPFVESISFANKTLNNQAASLTTTNFPVQQKQLETTEVYAYGNSENQIQLHNGHLLHQEGFTGEGKIIAVIDNGFIGVDTALPFQRLHTENLILGGYDFVHRSEDFYTGGNHGTRVLSTIGAFQEDELIGTAPNANYYLFITEDNTSETPLEESLWVEAAELADSLGVDIINTSLGYSVFDNPSYNYTYADMDGVTTFISRGANHAFSKGIICVTAAGNSGATSWQYITAPADAIGSFTVGAVNSTGAYASFSSIGPSADNRIKPDVMAQGVSTVNSLQNGTISIANGTSFSSPIMAGLVACLWQAFPELTAIELTQFIREASHLYDTPTAELGYGIPDFFQAYQTLSTDKFTANEWKIYPNPTSGIIYFYGITTTPNRFRLYDISGKNILDTHIQNNTSIDIHHLEKGIYIYQLDTDDGLKTGKILKK